MNGYQNGLRLKFIFKVKKATILALILTTTSVLAQESYLVLAGENPAIILPKKFRMQNPAFEDGYLTYADDSKSQQVKLNYDLLYKRVTFITFKGDTNLVVNDVNIKNFRVAGHRYEHILNTGYVKILAFHPKYALGSLTKLIEMQINKVSVGYGTQSASSVSASVSAPRRSADIKFTKETEHYLLDKRGDALKCRKSSFLKMFNSQSSLVKAFAKKEAINYHNEEDLIKLFNYCVSLYPEK